MRRLLFLLLILAPVASWSALLFPNNDPWLNEKTLAFNEIQELMGSENAARVVLESEGIVFWSNGWSPKESEGSDQANPQTLPSFTAVSANNEAQLRGVIQDQCACDISDKEVLGILIAHPNQAAIMHFRKGWIGHSIDEVDGVVPPLVIIYHEFAHVRDFVLNSEWFSDMAATRSKQWLNLAEESAVQAQNDLVLTLAAKRGLRFGLRRSYGQNELFEVDDLLSIQAIH